MGQTAPSQSNLNISQRIKPTPGISGRRARKGTLSIYCEKTHSIFSICTKPGMTIYEIKSMLPNRFCELKLSDYPLPNSATLESIGADSSTLVRMVTNDNYLQKSVSTIEYFPDKETPKIIGPKKQFMDKPQKPNHESISSVSEEVLTLNLRAYAVPDLKLEKNYAQKYKKPLH
ncbi:hypothetical protein SteCoe_28346 [Stentor coeruleus]|uniref:Uncharacterized protein n=1 Tax=Stentor coeruleus TaxID=5963 RepID=A0A1R2B8F7_9CILI|nr:hypothetical protein SteCoe_28346 [Stentor coeruleus]